MVTRSDDPARQFTVVDVGILILEAVSVLHARGHERLRIFPGMSGSGMHWRTAVTHASNFANDGFTRLRDFDAAFSTQPGPGSRWRVSVLTHRRLRLSWRTGFSRCCLIQASAATSITWLGTAS
jgi:hypothetical protein